MSLQLRDTLRCLAQKECKPAIFSLRQLVSSCLLTYFCTFTLPQSATALNTPTGPLNLPVYHHLCLSSVLCSSSSLRSQVGFFPCDCVELINDKIPPSVQSSVPKPGTLQRASVLLLDDLFKTCFWDVRRIDLKWLLCACVSS